MQGSYPITIGTLRSTTADSELKGSLSYSLIQVIFRNIYNIKMRSFELQKLVKMNNNCKALKLC